MAFATSKIIACVCAFCAAEMAGELFRSLSEKLPVDGACPRLWCRADLRRNFLDDGTNAPPENIAVACHW